MNHRQLAIARKVKFIFEKGAFISFAFDTHKGINKKYIVSLFPSKREKNTILVLLNLLHCFLTRM